MKSKHIDEKLQKVVSEFNLYRDPECHADIIKATQDFLEVEFTGTVADYACCFDENFIDFKFYVLDLSNEELEIDEIKRKKRDKFVVKYSRKNRR